MNRFVKCRITLSVIFIITTNLIYGQGVPAYVSQKDLVGWYPFNGNAKEESGNGNNGLVYGAIPAKDRFNKDSSAFTFDGKDDYIDIGLIPLSSFSISGWYRVFDYPESYTSTSQWAYAFVSKLHHHSGFSVFQGIEIRFQNDKGGSSSVNQGSMGAQIGTGSTWSGSGFKVNPTGSWRFFAYTYNAKTKRAVLYNNLDSTAFTTSYVDLNRNMYIGARPVYINAATKGFLMKGDLDDIGIWNRPLTNCEVSNLYFGDKFTLLISAIDSVNCYQGSEGSISTSISGGRNGYKYQWNDGALQTTSKASNLKKGTYKLIAKDIYGCSDSISGTVNEPAKVTLAITAIDSVNCYQGSDGSITTSVSGGSNGYKYQWNDSATQTTSKASNLKNGTYKLIAKDIYGCSDSISVTLNEPAKVTLAITAIDSVNCYQGSDGSITTSISGVSIGYKYQWNDGAKQATSKASNLKKGTYKLIAKDIYGCSDSISGTVNEPAKVTLAITAIDSVNCYQGSDGSIMTSISGGSNGYKYQWNDGAKQTTSKASNLKKGAYKLIAKDIYGCSDSINVGVNEPNKVVITITNIDSAFCYGYADGSITTVTTGGSKGYKYQWNDALKQTTPKSNKLTKGTYKIIVKDIYGCSDSAIGTVNEPARIVPMIMSNRLTMEGMSYEIYADISPAKKYKYDWTPVEIFFGDLYGKERPVVQFYQSRMVRLDVTDSKGCKGFDTASIVVVRPISKIIPTGFTPNADALNEGFGLPDIFEIESFEVFDRWGGMVFRGSSKTPRWDGKLNGEVLPAGVYTYTIQAKLKGTEQVVKHGGSVVLIK
jgi:gliding motility-associated-like protein